MNTALTVTVITILVILSAFFSSCEIAFAKSNKLRIKLAAEKGDRISKIAAAINDNYGRSLSTVLIGNNLVNIAASSFATALFISLITGIRTEAFAQTAATITMTAVLLLFGETLPKIAASSAPDKFARIFTYPLSFFMILFKPAVTLVNSLVNKISPLWTPGEEQQVTPEELCGILEDIEEEGVFTEDEGELIKSAIEFTDTTAYEILTPRVDITAIDIDDLPDFMDASLYKYSRVPVYRNTIDNIIGILPLKKVLRELADGKTPDIEGLMVEPLFVHKTRTASSLIREFRKERRQIAVVVDEYGGTMGIVTMEDIIEELVGDIFDETDTVENEIIRLDGNTCEADGGMNIYDLFDELYYNEPSDFETDSITVGGFVTELLDRFPAEGDSVTYDRLVFTVTSVQSMRVESVQVELLPEKEDETGDGEAEHGEDRKTPDK